VRIAIGDFELADGTLAGGFALDQSRVSVERVFDIVVPLAELLPVLFDRNVRRTTVDFQIARIHASMEAADIYAIDHDAMVPDSGLVQFTATNGAIRWLLHAALITHQLVDLIGATTIHSYHVIGGHFSIAVSYMLTETGDYVLMETGDKIELEN